MPYTELIEDRLRFIEIDQSDIVELQQAREYIEPEIDAMLDRFYEHVLGYPEFKALFEDEESIRRARESQKRHWLNELFGGHFKSSYFNKADRIGRTHARVGLAPSWYVGSYSKKVQAVCKAVLLDVDLVTHCYLEAKNEAMRQVLRRATTFATDIAELSTGLGETGSKVEDAAAMLEKDDTGSGGRAEQLAELRRQVASLVEQSRAIEQRIGELQFRDKLYIEDDPTTLERLKSLFSRN